MTSLGLPRAVGVAALLLALVAATALAALLADPSSTRAALAFSFPTLPRTLGEIASILLNNLRMLAALVVACWAAQLAAGADGAAGIWVRGMMGVCDAAVVLATANHVVLVGAGIGAYASRMIVALLPHGPLELAAFSLGLALYVSARRRERIDRRRWVATISIAILLLALAAPLEVLPR